MNWLLLRGLSREQRHWGDFPATLESSLPNARVFCLDLPGTGTEAERASPSTIDAILKDVRARWLDLRVSNPSEWNLLGISLGGMIALRWAEKHAQDFARLVVINSSAGNLSMPYHRLRLEVLGSALATLTQRDRVAREFSILKMTTRLNADRLPGIASRWAELAQESPISPATSLRQITAAVTFRAPDALKMPLLVVSSLGDRFTSPECSRALARRFQAETATHPTAGHDLPLDDPSWLCQQIAKWYPRCSPSVS